MGDEGCQAASCSLLACLPAVFCSVEQELPAGSRYPPPGFGLDSSLGSTDGLVTSVGLLKVHIGCKLLNILCCPLQIAFAAAFSLLKG